MKIAAAALSLVLSPDAVLSLLLSPMIHDVYAALFVAQGFSCVTLWRSWIPTLQPLPESLTQV